jgi:hypothetical protein
MLSNDSLLQIVLGLLTNDGMKVDAAVRLSRVAGRANAIHLSEICFFYDMPWVFPH